MPYNYILIEGTAITETIKYSELELQDTLLDQDQIQVIRIFDTSSVPELVLSPLTARESYAARALPKLEASGSTMYSLNESAKTIKMSTDTDDYTWEDVNHHSRGSDIDLPVASSSDTLVIIRKTDAKLLDHLWLPTDYLHEDLLRGNDQQILNIQQEVRSRDNLISKLEHILGVAGGVVPLDEDGLVDDSLFPEGIGGSGTFTDNLGGTRLESFGDVMDTLSSSGATLEYLVRYFKPWVPTEPFRYLEDLGRRHDVGVLRWQKAPFIGWSAKGFKLGYLSNVQAKIDLPQGGEDPPEHGHMLAYYPAFADHKKWSLAGLPADVSPDTDGAVLFWNTSNTKWEASTEMIDEVPVFPWVDQKYWMGDMSDGGGSTWVTFTDDPPSDWSDRPDHPGTANDDPDANIRSAAEGHPKLAASVLGYNAATAKWETMPFQQHRYRNWWVGSATETDPSSPRFSNGKVGNNKPMTLGQGNLWESYEMGDVPIWDETLPAKDQEDDTTEPHGSWRVAKLFSWDPVVVADQEAAPEPYDNYDPSAGLAMPVAVDGVLRIKQLGIDNLGKVTTSGSHAPSEGTFLAYNENDDEWYPKEFDGSVQNSELILNASLIASWIESTESPAPYGSINATRQWTPQVDMVIPFNSVMTQYKLLDCWKVLMYLSKSTNYTWLQPPYNTWGGSTFDIPWETGFPPYNIEHGGYYNGYFAMDDSFTAVHGCNIMSWRVDVLKVTIPEWTASGSNPTETITTIASNIQGSEDGNWSTCNVSFNEGDILRFKVHGWSTGVIGEVEGYLRPVEWWGLYEEWGWADTQIVDLLYDSWWHHRVGRINGHFKITPT